MHWPWVGWLCEKIFLGGIAVYSSSTYKSLTVSFMPHKTVVLVGLMGSGKTSIGKRLAQKFEIPFHDSDYEVEQAAGCTLSEIQDIYGEENFRQGEYRVISRLLEQPTHVLATGGTTFLHAPTREIVKENAISIWLNADLPTVMARVARRNDRVHNQPTYTEESVQAMMDECYPLYAEADVHVTTLDEPTNFTVDRVIEAMSEYIRINYPEQQVFKSL